MEPTAGCPKVVCMDRVMGALRRFTSALLCLALGLLLSSMTVEARNRATVETAQAGSGAHLVHFANGYLTVMARDVALGELLDEIARHSGLTVVRHVALNQRVTLQFHRLPLEEGLRRILRHRSFVLEYAEPTANTRSSAVARPKTLSILPQGSERYSTQEIVVSPMRGGSSEKDGAARVLELQVSLASGDGEAREEAALALGRGGRTSAVAPLSLALADANRDVRRAAVRSLAEVGGVRAAEALHIALVDPDPRVRESAVDALGEIGGAVAIRLLEQALADEVEYVRDAAADTLDGLKGRSR